MPDTIVLSPRVTRRAVPASDTILPVLDLDANSRVVRRAVTAPVISAADLAGARPRAPQRPVPVAPVASPDPAPDLGARLVRRLRAAVADSRIRIALLTAILVVLGLHVLGPPTLPRVTRDAIEAPFPPPGHAIAFVVPHAF
ncbi:hypothetical protein [Salinarimonas rosea]|uniref:hypothetical protein n=1 Tax=Salinarimonas rosea TaxID=552063 RepID=UPI00041A8A50|nr:hypothetical protein [Salinarimonas rosea]